MIHSLHFKTKYFLVFPCLASLFLFGCGKGWPCGDVKIEENLDSDAVITEKNEKYEAHITHVPEGITSVSFKSPENLSDTTFEHKNGKYTVSRGGLLAEYNLDPLEKTSLISELSAIFEALNNSDNLKADSAEGEDLIFKINFENSGANIRTNKDGKILAIEMPSRNKKIDFV